MSKRARRNFAKILITLGLLLLAAALLLGWYNFRLDYNALLASRSALQQLAQDIGTGGPHADFREHPELEMPTLPADGNDYIGVVTLNDFQLPVISQWSDAALKTAPCRYTGSAYTGDLILCGHDYRSHFGPIKDLRPGDPVDFVDTDGNVFRYEVIDSEILQPTQLDLLQAGEWDLTLFTCTYRGDTRHVVRCSLLNGQE